MAVQVQVAHVAPGLQLAEHRLEALAAAAATPARRWLWLGVPPSNAGTGLTPASIVPASGGDPRHVDVPRVGAADVAPGDQVVGAVESDF